MLVSPDRRLEAVMSFDTLLLALVIAYFGWRLLSSFLVRRRLPALLKEGAQVVDVRNPGEFAGGHAPGSVNIPLSEIDARAGDLDKSRQVIVCCASGTRSAMAAHRLRRLGFARVLNAGSWRTLR
jgi:rhodanese-related sulfurtransferase